ncbi:MAG TPA: Asp-tRNA(Asn)/Glu-tRNA(Gln) amidotransferase subunit GatA [Candidatus Methylacidiphilales bacterium]|jgi:aspartyl-tRNA(Asn)/glutamyl-tRNA(Gln) amidotransferase subunit A|nr:Asp-tRNA(Asn)/Glu-tRNA(Gln) amidotransferase subunit GatA [Candidatus Methylacidiphilales bacterium]
MTSLTIPELRQKLQSRAVTPRDVVDQLAARVEAVDPKLKAYLHLDVEKSRAAADTADPSLPLGGVPIAIKDVINVKGDPCTCASKILQGYVSPYDATVIAKLRAAGAVPFGRTNMDEFAMGSSTENSSWGVTRNPWDLDRIPGGSSGGSAAAVAGHEAFAALGTDTGGSIRQPAALCSCVGLKPTYGRVSRYGLVAFASSLDQIGTFTKTTEEAALLLEIIAGHDPLDNTSVDRPVPRYTSSLRGGVSGLRLGVPKEYFIEGIDPEVERAVRAAIDEYKRQGAEIVEVSLPHTKYAVAVYYIIATAEASANLARFDGVRYGKRASNPRDILDMYGRTRAEGFGAEVKRRIILGTYVLSSGYYDAYYNRAQKVRHMIAHDFREAFKKCDALLTPTSPTAAFKIGERTQDPLQMYLADIFTIAVNLAGICGVSIPCGFTANKLPIGLQIIGKKWGEETMLRVAHAYEQATPWHKEKPPI